MTVDTAPPAGKEANTAVDATPATPPSPTESSRFGPIIDSPDRGDRFVERQERFDTDRQMPDALRAAYEDRTLWDLADAADFLGVSVQQLHLMYTSSRRPWRPNDHPGVFIPADAFRVDVAVAWQRVLFEAGRVREWSVLVTRTVPNLTTGEFPRTRRRLGNVRKGRTTLGRRHQPGAGNPYREQRRRGNGSG